jgi:hypothetical protein
MKYAISVLQKAAYELGGEILTEAAIGHQITETGEVGELAQKILFGSLVGDIKTEKQARFVELLKAIRVLQEATIVPRRKRVIDG